MRRFVLVLCTAFLLVGCTAYPSFMQDSTTTVLVAGATGRAGSAIREELRAQGYEVRSLTRNKASAIARFGADWDWAEGDVKNKAALRIAMRGVKVVISAIGAREANGPNGPEFVDYGGMRNLVEAAEEAGVQHFILISSAAAGRNRKKSTMTQVGQIRYWKTMGENAVKRSAIPYTIIGPGGLVEEGATSKGLSVLSRADYVTGEIAIGDLAEVAVGAIAHQSSTSKTFALIWDDSAERSTWKDQLDTLLPDALTEESNLEPEPSSPNQ